MARKLGSSTFTIVSAPLVLNPLDNTSYRDWQNATQVVVKNASVQPFRMAEKLNLEINKEREFSRTGLRFFAPPGIRVDANDRIVYDNEEYSVFGHLGIWKDRRGREHHVEFLARRREG
jgi:hypothetical protein